MKTSGPDQLHLRRLERWNEHLVAFRSKPNKNTWGVNAKRESKGCRCRNCDVERLEAGVCTWIGHAGVTTCKICFYFLAISVQRCTEVLRMKWWLYWESSCILACMGGSDAGICMMTCQQCSEQAISAAFLDGPQPIASLLPKGSDGYKHIVSACGSQVWKALEGALRDLREMSLLWHPHRQKEDSIEGCLPTPWPLRKTVGPCWTRTMILKQKCGTL